MIFSIDSYRVSKAKIVDQIKAGHDWENSEGFIADGVICPEVYAKQPIKILAMLAESYGYDKNGCVDIEDQLDGDVLGLGNPRVKTSRHLATMLYLLIGSLENGQGITDDEWKDVPHLFRICPQHTSILQRTLAKIAWINVKKASNPNRQKNSACVRLHARRNREILKAQIDSVCPDVIFLFGNDVFGSALELGIIPEVCTYGKMGIVQQYEGRTYMELSHPASSGWMGYDGVFEIYEAVFNQIKKK